MTTDHFIKNKIGHVDYKDLKTLDKFLNPHGRIIARRHTGLTAKSQKKVTKAVKNARFLALIPFVKA